MKALAIAMAVLTTLVASLSAGATTNAEGVSSLSYAPKPFYDDLSRMRVRFTTTGRARAGYHYVVLLAIRGPDALGHPTGDPGCAFGAGSTVKGSYVPHERVLGAPGKTHTIWLRAYRYLGGEYFCHGRAEVNVCSCPIKAAKNDRVLRTIRFRVLRAP